MTSFNKQIISLIQQAQERHADALDLTYDKVLRPVNLADLNKVSYHIRKPLDSQIKVIVDSLAEYGFLGGIYVNAKTNEVVDGWHRAQIWQQMGNETIPAHWVEFQSKKQEREFHLRVNQVLATFTPEDFSLTFNDIDLLDFGFTEEEVANNVGNEFTQDKIAVPRPEVSDQYKKFTTTLKKEQYVRLQDLKKRLDLPHMADVIETLIDSYEGL